MVCIHFHDATRSRAIILVEIGSTQAYHNNVVDACLVQDCADVRKSYYLTRLLRHMLNNEIYERFGCAFTTRNTILHRRNLPSGTPKAPHPKGTQMNPSNGTS